MPTPNPFLEVTEQIHYKYFLIDQKNSNFLDTKRVNTWDFFLKKKAVEVPLVKSFLQVEFQNLARAAAS